MSGGMWNWGLMNLIPVLSFIALLAICYLAWKQTWVVVSNENKPTLAKLDKVIAIAAAVCALLILIFTIIFISTTLGDIRDYYLGRRAPKNVHVAFKLSLGLAPILTLLLTGAIAALPFVPVATNMLGGFENAQANISFAPLFKKKNPTVQQGYAPAPGYNGAPYAPPAPQATPAPHDAAYAAGELKQYKELLDAGVITQADFDAKKAQILNINNNQ